MSQEERCIVFDYEETYKAIHALCVHEQVREPPPGSIGAITPDKEDGRKLKVRIDNAQSGSFEEKEYTQDFLASALILYCQSSGVPLPKQSSKSVDINSENVTLRIAI